MPGGRRKPIVVAVCDSLVGDADIVWLSPFALIPGVSFSSFESLSSEVDKDIIRRCNMVTRLVLPLLLGPRRRNDGTPSLLEPDARDRADWV